MQHKNPTSYPAFYQTHSINVKFKINFTFWSLQSEESKKSDENDDDDLSFQMLKVFVLQVTI